MIMSRTIMGIDAEMVNLHWYWLHATWEGDQPGVEKAQRTMDKLLEERMSIALGDARLGAALAIALEEL